MLNIYALNNNTDTEIRVASFDGTDTTFEIPDVREVAFTTMDEMNANGQFALPKIYDRLKDGYTISFESAGNVNVQIKAINDEELATMTAVPEYLTEYFAQQGIVYAYAVPQTALAGGNDLQLPAAVYLENGELKNAIVSATDPQGKTLTVQDGTVNVMNLGDYTVTYTAGTETYEHVVKAERSGMPTSLAVSASDVSSAIEKTGDYAGLNVNLDGEKENFSGMLNGVFTGDTKVDFRFPLDADTVAGSKVIFTVSDLNGNAVFDIVFDAGDGYATLPYIDYNGKIRAGVRNTQEAGWKPAVLFRQRIFPGESHGTGFPNFASSNNTTVGYFSLEWAEDVLNIWYLASNQQPLKLAAFDGTDATLEIPENRIIVFNTESELNANAQFALPKIYDRLKDGYTISFESIWHNEINFVSINGAALNQDVLTVQDVTYDVNIEGEENKEITVPQDSEVYADITYNLFFTNGWSVQQPNRVKVDVDTSATGARTAIVTDPAALQRLGVDVQVTYTVNVREKTAEEIFADMAEKINMEAGAAIRLEEPAGLRFTTCVDKLAADTLASLYDEVAYGTMIVPEDMLAGKTLQELYGDESVLKVQSSGFYAEQNGSYIYRASIVNIRDYNYTRNFVGIGYVACADGVIFAQQYEATSRSVYSVAQKAFSDRVATADDVYCNEIDGLYSPYTAEQLSRIKELFIDAVVEIDTEGQYCGRTQYYEPAYLAEVQTDGDTGTRVVTVTSQTEIKTVYFGGEKVEQGRLSFSNGNKTVTFSAE